MLAAVSTLSEAAQDGAPRSRIVVARLGTFKDPRYGTFEINAKMAAGWQRNLSEAMGGRIAIDLDHSPERGRGTEAAGWITALEVDGKYVYGQVEWTPLGEQAIKDKRYLYVSPTFTSQYRDEEGRQHGDTLVGLALTNRPVLRRDMPTLNLSRDDLAFALEQDTPETDGVDSRAVMPDLTKIAAALHLSADADEATVLDAIAKVHAPAPTKTLAEQAADAGMVVLSTEAHQALTAKADEGATAIVELSQLKAKAHEDRFDTEFAAALDKGTVLADDDTRADWRALYEAAPDLTIKRLSALTPLVPMTGGETTGREQTDGAEPEGMDNVELDRKVQAYAAEHKLSYTVALDHVLTQES